MSDELHLTVVKPFGEYARGERITDPDKVAELLASHPEHVVKHLPHDREG